MHYPGPFGTSQDRSAQARRRTGNPGHSTIKEVQAHANEAPEKASTERARSVIRGGKMEQRCTEGRRCLVAWLLPLMGSVVDVHARTSSRTMLL